MLDLPSGPLPIETLKQAPHRIVELATTERFSFDGPTLAEI